MEWMQALSFITTLFTIGMFMAGIPDCLKIIRTGSTENVPFLPFLTTNMNNILWFSYGYLKGDNTLMHVNGVGSFLQTTYMFVYLIFSPARIKAIQQTLVAFVAMMMLYVYLTSYVASVQNILYQLGFVCCTVTVVMYISPLAELANVFRTKSTDGISLPLTISTMFASSLWVLYGVCVNDPFIMIPNLPGVMSSLLRVFLIWKFKASSPTK